MRTFLSIALFSFLTLPGYAQNLVPNPSFEVYDTCPNNQNQIHYATGWSDYGNSSDYFNSCSGTFSVPNNWGGYQQAATGAAYAGLYTYESVAPNFAEYIGITLLSTLTAGTKYYVSFKAVLALDISQIFNRATNNLGVLFSNVQYTSLSPPPIGNYAHINYSQVIIDTADWVIINGSFVSDSAYENLIIGRFFDDANTSIVYMQDTIVDQSAYYFIDDVCVSEDSLTCELSNRVVQNDRPERTVLVYPNPFSQFSNLHFSGFTSSTELIRLRIFDITGTIMRDKQVKVQNQYYLLERGTLRDGIYFLQIETKSKTFTQKIIIIL